MSAAPLTDEQHTSDLLDSLIDTGLALDAQRRLVATIEPLMRDAHAMLRDALTCECGHPDSHITAATDALDAALMAILHDRLARS